jgi:hypothetical protein
MKKMLAVTAVFALMSAGAVLPSTAHAQPARLDCDQTVNTQHPPTVPQGPSVDTDRRAPCEQIEGAQGTGTTGPAMAAPPSTEGGGGGQSQ